MVLLVVVLAIMTHGIMQPIFEQEKVMVLSQLYKQILGAIGET
jgi:hypothetical protein